MSTLPETVSAVTVSEPIDGTVPRRRRVRSQNRLLHGSSYRVTPKTLMQAARRACHPHQRIKVISDTVIMCVNIPPQEES